MLLTPIKRKSLEIGVALGSLLAGIVVSFILWDGSPFDVSRWTTYNPLARATLGSFLALLVFFPFTVPVLALIAGLYGIGTKWRAGRWLRPASVLLAGVLWVCWVAYVCTDPLD